MASVLFLLACLATPSMLVLAAPYGVTSTIGTYPQTAPYNPYNGLQGSLGYVNNYGLTSGYSTGFMGAQSYFPSAKTAQLIASLQAQVAAAEKKGFAAGAQAGYSSALGALAGQYASYPGVGVAGYPAVGVAGYPAAGMAGYPAVAAGAAVAGGAYPAGAVAVNHHGSTVEEVRVGGVPVSQQIHSVGVATVPVNSPYGPKVSAVPVSTKTLNTLGVNGLPISKTIQQVGGVPLAQISGAVAAYFTGLGGVISKVPTNTFGFGTGGFTAYG